MQRGEIKLKICKIQIGMSIWALGDRFNDHIKVIYADTTLRKHSPLISQSVREYIVCLEDVKKLNSIGEKGSDLVIHPSADYGSCGITMNHFVDNFS